MNKFDGLHRPISTVHPSFPISGSSGDRPVDCPSNDPDMRSMIAWFAR
jgi:hypothetical protein